MKVARTVLALIILVILFVFSIYNALTLFNCQTPHLPLFLVLIFAFFLGFSSRHSIAPSRFPCCLVRLGSCGGKLRGRKTSWNTPVPPSSCEGRVAALLAVGKSLC